MTVAQFTTTANVESCRVGPGTARSVAPVITLSVTLAAVSSVGPVAFLSVAPVASRPTRGTDATVAGSSRGSDAPLEGVAA